MANRKKLGEEAKAAMRKRHGIKEVKHSDFIKEVTELCEKEKVVLVNCNTIRKGRP
jgi:hypothetical protein